MQRSLKGFAGGLVTEDDLDTLDQRIDSLAAACNVDLDAPSGAVVPARGYRPSPSFPSLTMVSQPQYVRQWRDTYAPRSMVRAFTNQYVIQTNGGAAAFMIVVLGHDPEAMSEPAFVDSSTMDVRVIARRIDQGAPFEQLTGGEPLDPNGAGNDLGFDHSAFTCDVVNQNVAGSGAQLVPESWGPGNDAESREITAGWYFVSTGFQPPMNQQTKWSKMSWGMQRIYLITGIKDAPAGGYKTPVLADPLFLRGVQLVQGYFVPSIGSLLDGWTGAIGNWNFTSTAPTHTTLDKRVNFMFLKDAVILQRSQYQWSWIGRSDKADVLKPLLSDEQLWIGLPKKVFDTADEIARLESGDYILKVKRFGGGTKSLLDLRADMETAGQVFPFSNAWRHGPGQPGAGLAGLRCEPAAFWNMRNWVTWYTTEAVRSDDSLIAKEARDTAKVKLDEANEALLLILGGPWVETSVSIWAWIEHAPRPSTDSRRLYELLRRVISWINADAISDAIPGMNPNAGLWRFRTWYFDSETYPGSLVNYGLSSDELLNGFTNFAGVHRDGLNAIVAQLQLAYQTAEENYASELQKQAVGERRSDEYMKAIGAGDAWHQTCYTIITAIIDDNEHYPVTWYQFRDDDKIVIDSVSELPVYGLDGEPLFEGGGSAQYPQPRTLFSDGYDLAHVRLSIPSGIPRRITGYAVWYLKEADFQKGDLSKAIFQRKVELFEFVWRPSDEAYVAEFKFWPQLFANLAHPELVGLLGYDPKIQRTNVIQTTGVNHKGRLIVASPQKPNVYLSGFNGDGASTWTQWPTDDSALGFFAIDQVSAETIQKVTHWQGFLLVFTTANVYIYDVGDGNLSHMRLKGTLQGQGTTAWKSIVSDNEYGVFWANAAGIYLWQGGNDAIPISDNSLRNWWRTISSYLKQSTICAGFDRLKGDYWLSLIVSGAKNGVDVYAKQGGFRPYPIGNSLLPPVWLHRVYRFNVPMKNWRWLEFAPLQSENGSIPPPYIRWISSSRPDGVLEFTDGLDVYEFGLNNTHNGVSNYPCYFTTHKQVDADIAIDKILKEIWAEYRVPFSAAAPSSLDLSVFPDDQVSLKKLSFTEGRTRDKRLFQTTKCVEVRIRGDFTEAALPKDFEGDHDSGFPWWDPIPRADSAILREIGYRVDPMLTKEGGYEHR